MDERERPDTEDRRSTLRREEDQDIRDQVKVLNLGMFGHPEAPETGLMARHRRLENKIDALIGETQRAKWAAIAAAVSFLAAIVTAVVLLPFS